MTVNVNQTDITLACDGATTSFSLAGFLYLAKTDLVVELVAADGTITPWTLGSEYNLGGDGSTGSGTLTPTAGGPYAAGFAICAYRATDDIQNQQLDEGGNFPAKNVERAFDRRTLRSQELRASLLRSVRVPRSEPALDELPGRTMRALKPAAYDADGQPAVMDTTTAEIQAAVQAYMAGVAAVPVAIPVPSIAALLTMFGAAVVLAAGTAFVCAGRDGPSDYGGGVMVYTGTGAGPAEDGGRTRIDPYGRRFQFRGNMVFVELYGAKGGLLSAAWATLPDATAGLNAAWGQTNCEIHFTPGFAYRITGTLTTAQGVNIRGCAAPATPPALSGTVIYKDFAGLGIAQFGDYSRIVGVTLINQNGAAYDNWQATGTRCTGDFLSSHYAGRDAFRIGSDAVIANTNLFTFGNLYAWYPGRHAVYVNDQTGITDVNGGMIRFVDCTDAADDGIVLDGCQDVIVEGWSSQFGAKYGVRITANSRGCRVGKCYVDSNVSGGGIIEAGALGHTVEQGGYLTGGVTWTDLSTPGNNNIMGEYVPDIPSGIDRSPKFNNMAVYAPSNGAPTAIHFLSGAPGSTARHDASMTVVKSGTGTTFSFALNFNGVMTDVLDFDAAGNVTLLAASGVLLKSATTLTNGAGAGAGTLTNAPAAGNPTKWIEINDNGTIRKIPTWT